MKRFLFVIAALLILFPATVSAGPVLRVAVEDHYPPYSFKDADGNMAGFNVDIANALAQVLGMECQIFSVAWDDILPRLARGDFDAAVACMAVKPERLQYADFTDFYIQSKSGFIGKKTLPQDISREALTGKKLVSQVDTAQFSYIEKTYGDVATVTATDTMDEAFLAVAQGKSDLAACVLLAGYEFLKKPEGQDCDIIGPAFDEKDFGYSKGNIAVRKGDTELVQKLNDALRVIRTNGTYAKYGRKYFPFSPY